MTSLTESLELLKEQSKSKMMAAIEKMKELKGHLGSKTEEIAAGVLRITELEESLVSVNQDVVKYKSAMEKAMPKFRELKVQLDAKVSECDANEKENTQLKNRIVELEGLGEKQMIVEAPVNLLCISDIDQSAASATESVSVPVHHPVISQQSSDAPKVGSSKAAAEQSANIVPAVNTEDQKDETQNSPDCKQLDEKEREIAELVALVAGLKESNEEIKNKAVLNENVLKGEIETLKQVSPLDIQQLSD